MGLVWCSTLKKRLWINCWTNPIACLLTRPQDCLLLPTILLDVVGGLHGFVLCTLFKGRCKQHRSCRNVCTILDNTFVVFLYRILYQSMTYILCCLESVFMGIYNVQVCTRNLLHKSNVLRMYAHSCCLPNYAVKVCCIGFIAPSPCIVCGFRWSYHQYWMYYMYIYTILASTKAKAKMFLRLWLFLLGCFSCIVLRGFNFVDIYVQFLILLYSRRCMRH